MAEWLLGRRGAARLRTGSGKLSQWVGEDRQRNESITIWLIHIRDKDWFCRRKSSAPAREERQTQSWAF